VKKLLLLVAVLSFPGCALVTPYAQWPNGKPMYPGAYKIEMDRINDPNYHPTAMESFQRKLACNGPEMLSTCPSPTTTHSGS
jgi:hypothetical protein